LAEPRLHRHGVVASFGYAFEGLASAWRTQPNFRIHVVLAAVLVAGGVVVRIAPVGWAVLALAIGLVVAAELFNTALEAAVDLASPQEHPLAKLAKDIAAAGVLIASLAAAVASIAVLVGGLVR
jgi:diacylglycerol kinase